MTFPSKLNVAKCSEISWRQKAGGRTSKINTRVGFSSRAPGGSEDLRNNLKKQVCQEPLPVSEDKAKLQ